MGKIDKRTADRNSGMVRAFQIAKEQGIDALAREIKFRNATNMPYNVSIEKCDEYIQEISQNIFQSYRVMAFKVLREKFGFGKERLHRFNNAFKENVLDIWTVDSYGDTLYTFSDYAKEFNKEFGLDLDVDEIEKIDDHNKSERRIGVDMNAIEELLRDNGFEGAAEFIHGYGVV